MPLSKADILKAEDVVLQELDVPEWKGKVWLRVFGGEEREMYEAACYRGRESKDFRTLKALVVVYSVCDKDGQRLFTEADIPALNRKSSLAIDRIFRAAQDLSMLTEESVEAAKRNFPTGQNASSGSPSPSRSATNP